MEESSGRPKAGVHFVEEKVLEFDGKETLGRPRKMLKGLQRTSDLKMRYLATKCDWQINLEEGGGLRFWGCNSGRYKLDWTVWSGKMAVSAGGGSYCLLQDMEGLVNVVKERLVEDGGETD